MADAGNNEVWNYIFGGLSSILGGLFLHNAKKINDLPEKYVLKADYNIMNNKISEDIKGSEERITAAITRLHERMDRHRSSD